MSLLATVRRDAGGLALFAALTVGVVALTEWITRDEIEAQRRLARERALLEILPADRFDNAILDDRVELADPRLGLDEPEPAYLARRGGEAFAALLPVVVPDGYAGPIRLVVGVRRDGAVLGVRVLEHRETPGLGDAIEVRKSDWIRAFRGRALGDPPAEAWAVERKGGAFDAMTGATITSEAVIRGVRRGLEWYREEGRARLFEPAETPGEDP